MAMKRISWIAPIAGLVLGIAGSAQAVTISVSAGPTSTGTADFLNDTLTDHRQNRSSTSVTDAGGSTADVVSASVNAQARYAGMVAADGGIATAPSRTATQSYTVSFTVSAGAGTIYDITLDTSRIGAITRVDDGTGGGSGTISAVTGLYGVNAAPSISAFSVGSVSMSQGTGAANTPFSQSSSTVTITGLTGTNTINLSFSWSATATSTCTGSLCSSTGNDEVAVRLGMAGTTSNPTADDYPGVGSRTQSSDGHFVTANAVVTYVVPEPGTLALLGFGLAGLAISGRRRAA